MRSNLRTLIAVLLIGTMFLAPQASAVSLNLELDATEYIKDLVFYSDGTYSSGNITGHISITNPSANHTVSDINISFSDGISPSSQHFNELGPDSTTIISYEILGSEAIMLPSVIECVSPATLAEGAEQEVAFTVQIDNPTDENIDIIVFDKTFPDEFIFVGYTATSGILEQTENKFQWENFTLSPGSKETLQIVFNTNPGSDVILPPSNLSFSTPAFVEYRDLSLSAVTETRFTVEKEKIGNDEWKVGIVVEDASEFDYLLYGAEVYVSDPLLDDMELIREYDLDIRLEPGQFWGDSFTHHYSEVPVFFARVYYTIPYTISGTSMPLTPVATGGFVINSAVYDTNREPEDDGVHYRILGTPENIDDGNLPSLYEQDLQIPPAEDIAEESNIPDDSKSRRYSSLNILLLLLIGSMLLAGKKYIPPLIASKKQLVVSSSSLEVLSGMGDLGNILSEIDEIIVSSNDFNTASAFGFMESLNGLIEKDRVNFIDTDEASINEIVEKYGITPQDAEILATAKISGTKEILTTSPRIEEVVRDMGLKPVHPSDLKTKQKK